MRNIRTWLGVGGTLIVIVAIVRWGGTARPGPLFVTGVALFIAAIFTFGLALWWLYFSPLPEHALVHTPGSRWLRQLFGLLALMSGFLFVIGGFWDEFWHRKFGGFGNDFFWPPHLMIYGSLALTALFAVVGILIVIRHSHSGVRAAFRANPHLGFLALCSGFFAASAPSDGLWHQIYGPDLTAWSLPHISLAVGLTATLLATAALQLATLPRRSWNARGIQWQEIATLLALMLAGTILVQIATPEWENIQQIGAGFNRDAAFDQAFWSRPEWLYPVVLITIAAFLGNCAVHALRRWWAAPVAALLVLAFRLIGLTAFDAWSVHMRFISQLLLVAPMIALGFWYARKQARVDNPRTIFLGNAIAWIALVLIDLPIISQTLIYPRINMATAPGMLVWSLVMALAAGWAGTRLGAWLAVMDSVSTESLTEDTYHEGALTNAQNA
jgi:hypothetical protein